MDEAKSGGFSWMLGIPCTWSHSCSYSRSVKMSLCQWTCYTWDLWFYPLVWYDMGVTIFYATVKRPISSPIHSSWCVLYSGYIGVRYPMKYFLQWWSRHKNKLKNQPSEIFSAAILFCATTKKIKEKTKILHNFYTAEDTPTKLILSGKYMPMSIPSNFRLYTPNRLRYTILHTNTGDIHFTAKNSFLIIIGL